MGEKEKMKEAKREQGVRRLDQNKFDINIIRSGEMEGKGREWKGE